MRYKIFNYIFAVLISIAFMSSVISADGTVFTIQYTRIIDEKIDISLISDKTNGIGGIDLIVTYNPERWELIENTEKTNIKKGIVKVYDGKIRLLCEAAEKIKTPNTLFLCSFKKINKNATIDNIALSINDYYDNSTEMNDLPYQVEYLLVDNIDTGVSTVKIVLIVASVLIILIASIICLKMKSIKKHQKNDNNL